MGRRLLIFARESATTLLLTAVLFAATRMAIANVRIDGISMLPTVHTGELALVDTLSYHFHGPQRGDVIILHPPVESSDDYIKRVIGLPGDRIQVVDGTVYVNGERLREPYLHEPHTYNWGPARVPRGDVFVLGDNRDVSYDSHMWPTPWLAENQIVGRAVLVYWPLSDLHILGSSGATLVPARGH